MIIPIENIPGISKLVVDYLSDFQKIAFFYSGDFHDITSFEITADQSISDISDSFVFNSGSKNIPFLATYF